MTPSVGTAKELLARLVSFDTTSAKTNIPLIEFVEAYLAEHGVKSQRVPTPDGLKASLFATIGSGEGGGIALSGHTDVVPVTSQNWETDPFAMVERDGKLYGRGTCDMKGYLACCLALPTMVEDVEDASLHALGVLAAEPPVTIAGGMLRVGRHRGHGLRFA